MLSAYDREADVIPLSNKRMNSFKKDLIVGKLKNHKVFNSFRWDVQEDSSLTCGKITINPKCYIILLVFFVIFLICGTLLIIITSKKTLFPQFLTDYRTKETLTLGLVLLTFAFVFLITAGAILMLTRMLEKRKRDYRCPLHSNNDVPHILHALPVGIFIDNPCIPIRSQQKLSHKKRRNTVGPLDSMKGRHNLLGSSNDEKNCLSIPVIFSPLILQNQWTACQHCSHKDFGITMDQYFDSVSEKSESNVACFPSEDERDTKNGLEAIDSNLEDTLQQDEINLAKKVPGT